MKGFGNYKNIREIGEGGFGRVFSAEHTILGEKVCLKQNKAASVDDARLLAYEAKLLWKLDEYHSIPSVKDFTFVDKETAVMVMKFIEGDNLEDLIEKKGALHAEDASWITERLLGALYYAHCHGVIHTDVKPQNVFVEPSKRDIKLIDFGLATYKPISTTRPIGYSPKYAPPELVAGKPPVPETDIYGAGIVMLRALGGDVAKKEFRKDTPKEIVEFCNRMLAYDVKERPSWEKENLIETLSDIRESVFGRRHMNSPNGKIVKGGGK